MNTQDITKKIVFVTFFCTVGCLERTRYELSDIFYENAKVASKKHETITGVPTISLIGNTVLIIPGYDTEEYEIVFDGDKRDFTVTEKDIYDRFTQGDDVVISYRETRRIVTELDRMTWREKLQKIDITNYEFVGVRHSAEGMCEEEMCYK